MKEIIYIKFYKSELFMAKQQVVQFDNGTSLIYQKQSVFNGYSFVIGFRSGAQLDGKYKGLSHLLEHLMFRTSSSKSMKKNVLNDILKYSINQNAYTTQNCISSTFSVTNDNVVFALENQLKMFMGKSFSDTQIKREIEIVKQEMNLITDNFADSKLSGLDALLTGLKKPTNTMNSLDLIGNARTLNQIKPEHLKKYIERYFNSNNLVISVTTNQSLDKVVELLNEHVFPKVPMAKSEKYIIPFPELPKFNEINALCLYPNPNCQNVTIDLLLRENIDVNLDKDKEFAFNVVEEYIMNSIGGVLWNVLREDNNLVYNYSLTNADYTTAKFKHFNATTNRAKMRKTVREVCTTIKNIGLYGVPKEKFEIVKQALTDQQNATLQKFKSCSASQNFESYMYDIPFIDYKKAFNYIKTMTYEEFNNYIQPIYSSAQASLAVDGSFDSRKMYNLVEIEELLGNYSHSPDWHAYNQPVAQATQMPDPRTEMIMQFADQLNSQLDMQEQLMNQVRDNHKFVTIDNEIVK